MAWPLRLKRERDKPNVVDLNMIDKTDFAGLGCDLAVLQNLQSKIEGRVVLPGFPDYDSDRRLSNPLFQSSPQVIVYCRGGGNDVVAALEAADTCNLPVTLRSGGHSTAGFSSGPGMIIDTGEMKSAVVSVQAPDFQSWARVQPGCNFGELNDTLDLYQMHVPSGGCPDVCPGGYMQGGGFGFTSRIYGMNCDNVLGVEVALADGTFVKANDTVNSDLYWAVRGGTGNNFGVITSIDYGLHEIPKVNANKPPMVWGYSLRWPLVTPLLMRQAAAALNLMQTGYMAGDTAPQLGYMCMVCWQSDTGNPADAEPYLIMRGMLVPPVSDPPEDYIADLRKAGGQLQYSTWGTYNQLNYMLLTQPVDIPQFPDGTPMPNEDKHARYLEKTLTVPEWNSMLELVVRRSPNKYSTLVIEPYGGAIGKVAPLATAFIHRNVSCDVFLDGFWWDEKDRPAVDAYLKEWIDFMEPHWNQHIYQNYPHVDLPDYRWNYWGDAFPTLLKVKQKYDPNSIFEFPQSIKPMPTDPTGLTVSTAEPLFDDAPIVRMTDRDV